MSGNHAIALTGTPGVGKSSLAEALGAAGWGIVDVEDAARDHGCLGETEADGAAPVDVHALSERWSPPDENIVVDGHLSHFLDVTAVVLLRCSPDLIRDRLAPRGYNDAKIQANVEWELTAGHWSELLEFEIDVPVLELDASKRSTASLAAEVLAWLADGCPAPPLLEAAAAATDWLNEFPLGVGGGLAAMYAPNATSGGWWLLGSALLISLAMLVDGLDGSLARAKGEVSRWGDYLDHTIDRILDATWVVCISASVFVDDLAFGFAAAFLTLLGSYMGTQAQAVAGSRNYRGFSRADRTVLTLVSLVVMGLMLLLGLHVDAMLVGPLDHVPVNPLSLIVLISALGGMWTFAVRFMQAQAEIRALDAADPLPQPNRANAEAAPQQHRSGE